MPSRHDPADSLHHIIENAERVARYLAGLDRQAFEQNEAMRDAVERCLERVCEAAYRLGQRAEELMPGQPWGDIRGMGNRLRHAYDRLDVASSGTRHSCDCPSSRQMQGERWRTYKVNRAAHRDSRSGRPACGGDLRGARDRLLLQPPTRPALAGRRPASCTSPAISFPD